MHNLIVDGTFKFNFLIQGLSIFKVKKSSFSDKKLV